MVFENKILLLVFTTLISCHGYTLNFPHEVHDCGTNVNVWDLSFSPQPACRTNVIGGSYCEFFFNQAYEVHVNYTADRQFNSAYTYFTETDGTQIVVGKDSCCADNNPCGTRCPIPPGVNQMYIGSFNFQSSLSMLRFVGKWEVLSRYDDHSKGDTIMCFVFLTQFVPVER